MMPHWEQYGTVLVSRGQLKQTSGSSASEMCCRLARAIPIPKGCHSDSSRVSLMLFHPGVHGGLSEGCF